MLKSFLIAATLLGMGTSYADEVIIKRDAPEPPPPASSTTTIEKHGPACDSKTVHSENDAGESKTVTRQDCD